MAHAATATHDYAQDVPAPREFSAFLRLRQGGAARTTWLVSEAPGGTMISVGADAACDWQIRAAFVPPRAFSILVVGGRAFVRSGPEPGLLLDGKPVDDGWNPLPAEARIDIGLARFEVRAGYTDAGNDEPVIELAQPRRHDAVGAWSQPSARDAERARAAERAQAAARVEAFARAEAARAEAARAEAMASTAVVQRQEQARQQPMRTASTRRKKTMETQEYGWAANGENSRVQRVGLPREPRVQELVTPAATAKPQAIRNSTIELNLDDLDYLGTIPMPRKGRNSEYEVSPSLLGSDEITRVTGAARGWRYVGIATFFATAYGAWLYLLDRI